MGASLSVTSTGMFATLQGYVKQDMPSLSKRAHNPPLKTATEKKDPPFLYLPVKLPYHKGVDPLPAMSRSGTILASAKVINSGSMCAIMVLPQVGAGCDALTTLPSGALILID